MKIIITGGSGLLGRSLTDSFTKDGHEVIILSRSPERVQNLPEKARAVKWDGKTTASWGELVDGAGAIINLAGEGITGNSFLPKRWTKKRMTAIRQSRLDAGKAVIRAVEKARVKPTVMIQSAAVGYYGVNNDAPATEDTPPADDFAALVVVDWENSTKAVEEMGVRRVVTRIGLPLTSKGGIFPRLALPFKLFAGGPIGSGKQFFSWIHIQDYIKAIHFLLENENARGVYNLTSPQPVTMKEFAHVLGWVMKRPAFFPVPAILMYLAFGKVAEIIVGGQNALPDRLQEAGFSFEFPDLEAALRNILGK